MGGCRHTLLFRLSPVQGEYTLAGQALFTRQISGGLILAGGPGQVAIGTQAVLSLSISESPMGVTRLDSPKCGEGEECAEVSTCTVPNRERTPVTNPMLIGSIVSDNRLQLTICNVRRKEKCINISLQINVYVYRVWQARV